MSAMQDARQAVRLMMKNRGFTAVALAVLALGIGANTALFSVLNAVLIKPLPYTEPDRLVQLGRELSIGRSNAVSPSQFLYWSEHNRSFSAMATYEGRGGGLNLVEGDRPERVASLGVSPGFFGVLGVAPQVGRDFLPEDGIEGAPKAVMISDGLWRRRFGGDAAVIGRPIRLSGEQRTVIGVMARGFDFINHADVWTPLALTFDPQDAAAVYYVVGRLQPEASLATAQTEMAAVAAALAGEHPALMREGEGVFAQPYLNQLVGTLRPALLMLLGAVALVLLIASANVANLLLARATERRREMALRTSLGASRGRIVRQLLAESLLLALLGGGLGLLVARAGVGLLIQFNPTNLPRLDIIEIDGPVVAFTIAIAVVTGVLFGLVPALQASKIDLQEALKEGSAGAGTGVGRGRARGALVVSEMALALVLLVGATLLLDSFSRVTSLDPGYDYQQVLTLKMSPGETEGLTTAKLTRFVAQAAERLEAQPGIEAAATISTLPLEHGLMSRFNVEGRDQPDSTEQEGRAQWRLISPDYFRAMDIPMLRGRTFNEHDTAETPPVIIINEALAERYFPDEDPIGKGLLTGGPEDPPERIIAVVGDISELALDRPPVPTIFAAATQASDGTTAFLANLFPTSWVIRTAGDPASYGPAVRSTILALDPEQPVSNLRPLAELMSTSIATRQLSTLLLTLFAGLALVLAVVGIYGVMSYAVAQRTQEIGIRQALGATGGATLRLILGQGLRLALIGIVLGILAALGLSRLLLALLFETTATDPKTFAAASLALLLAATAACLVPALRATRVDPLVALRNE